MILKIFLFWRISLFALTYLGSIIFPKVANGAIGAIGAGKTFDFFSSWAQWDGGHFINIARFGYFNPQEYAFFPLFPNIIRFVSIFTFGNEVLAALLISNISFFIFLIVFHKLVTKKYDSKIADVSLFTLLTFPTAFFGVAVYSESVFLLLVCLTLYFLENKKIILAASASTLATATRFVGVFLIIPFIFDYLKSIDYKIRNLNIKVVLIPASISGFFFYSLYLYLKFGDPFYFATVQSVWHRTFINPLSTIYSYLIVNPFGKPFNDYLDLVSTLGFLSILIIGIKKIPIGWWFFSLLVILVPASTGTLTSMPRYVLSAFPVFILMAIYLGKRPVLKMLIWGVFLTLQICLSILFVNGFWVS